MKNRDDKPICGMTIDGPKYGRRVVLWRKNCQRRVRQEGQRCWQHRRKGPDGSGPDQRAAGIDSLAGNV